MTAAAEPPEPSRAGAHADAAWVQIATPLSAADLRKFLDEIERLFRINPLLEVRTFAPIGDGAYRLVARNISNGRDIDTTFTVARSATQVEARYSQGLKAATSFRVEMAPGGAQLVVTDIYGGGSEAERRARASEVDLSLNAWGRALHDYLGAWARWQWLAPWRWYMRRVWQPMTPSARRIVWMIWVISAFEVATMVVLVAIWLLIRQAA